MKLNQRGIVHILTLVLLIVGLVVGIYLVSNPAIFRSRAFSESNVEISGKFYSNGRSTSRFIQVKPTYVGVGIPTNFRIANKPSQLSRATTFTYNPSDADRMPALFSLAVEDIDAPGQGVGKHSIYTQFLVNGSWTSPIVSNIQLEPTDNHLKITPDCSFGQFHNQGPYPITLSFDSGQLSDLDYVSLVVFSDNGGYLTDAGPIKPSDGKFRVNLPSLSENYHAFVTAAKLRDDTTNISELSFSCANQDQSVTITKSNANCDTSSCAFSWEPKPQGMNTTFEVEAYYYNPLLQNEELQATSVVQAKAATVLLQKGPMSSYRIIALKPTDNPQASGLQSKIYYDTGLTITPVPSTVASGSNCQISATPLGGNDFKISYSGTGGPVRVWIENPDFVSKIDGDAIGVDGKPPIRNYTGNLDHYGIFNSYELSGCDNGISGCSGSINKLTMPSGSYVLHCDINANGNRCTGLPACTSEGGKTDCVALNGSISCGNQDNARIKTGSNIR